MNAQGLQVTVQHLRCPSGRRIRSEKGTVKKVTDRWVIVETTTDTIRFSCNDGVRPMRSTMDSVLVRLARQSFTRVSDAVA